MRATKTMYGLLCILVSCAPGSLIQEPTLDVPQTDDVDRELVAEGIKMHDQGQYDAAIEIYDKAIARNPGNLEATYEKALTLLTVKRYQESQDLCRTLMKYRWDKLAGVYLMSGTNLDMMNRSSEAVKVYQGGLKSHPKDLLLWYNLGVTHTRRREGVEAKQAYKNALLIRPGHPSSNIALAGHFFEEGATIPALLAYSRFLVLEPQSQRSVFAKERLNILLSHGVSRDASKQNQINIQINPDQSTQEGDFSVVSMILSFKIALELGEGKSSDERSRLVAIYESICSGLAEGVEQGDKSGFVWSFYAPYFAEINAKKLVEQFVDRMFYPGTTDSEAFVRWSTEYDWPDHLTE